MTHVPRTPRAVEQRRALGKRLRAHRMANALTIVQVARHLRTGKEQMQATENAVTDVYFGTVIDIAELYGLRVALAAEHHLPLLDLTAAEVRAVIVAAAMWGRVEESPELRPALSKVHAAVRSALDKLTTTEETP